MIIAWTKLYIYILRTTKSTNDKEGSFHSLNVSVYMLVLPMFALIFLGGWRMTRQQQHVTTFHCYCLFIMELEGPWNCASHLDKKVLKPMKSRTNVVSKPNTKDTHHRCVVAQAMNELCAYCSSPSPMYIKYIILYNYIFMYIMYYLYIMCVYVHIYTSLYNIYIHMLGFIRVYGIHVVNPYDQFTHLCIVLPR